MDEFSWKLMIHCYITNDTEQRLCQPEWKKMKISVMQVSSVLSSRDETEWLLTWSPPWSKQSLQFADTLSERCESPLWDGQSFSYKQSAKWRCVRRLRNRPTKVLWTLSKSNHHCLNARVCLINAKTFRMLSQGISSDVFKTFTGIKIVYGRRKPVS